MVNEIVPQPFHHWRNRTDSVLNVILRSERGEDFVTIESMLRHAAGPFILAEAA